MRGQVPVAELPDRAAEEVDRPGEPRCRGPAPAPAPAQADRKLVSRLWEVARKLPAVAVVTSAGLVWTPEQFVRQHLGQVGLVMMMMMMMSVMMMMMTLPRTPPSPGSP